MLTMVVLVMTLIPINMMAEDYKALWKKYEAAMDKDLPQTGMKVLNSIAKKATREKRYGELLKAQLLHVSAMTSVSPDSLDSEVERLKAEADQAQGTDEVLAAVYANVLGRLYRDNRSLAGWDESVSADYFARSLRRPDLLSAVSADSYAPMVAKGADSRLFGGDLLHVLGMEAQAWDVLTTWYGEHGNRAATCYCTMHKLQNEGIGAKDLLPRLDSLIERYGDLPVCGEVAILRYQLMSRLGDVTKEEQVKYIDNALQRWGEWPRIENLREMRANLCLPSFQAALGEGVSLPDRPRQVKLENVVNLKSVTMTVQRVDVDGTCEWNPNNEKEYEKLRARLVGAGPLQRATRRFDNYAEWEVAKDSMTIEGLPLGMYLVEFTGERRKGNAMPARRSLLHVSNLYVMEEELPGREIRYVVVDAVKGQPVANAQLRLRNYKTIGGEKDMVTTLKTDEYGEVTYHYLENRRPDFVYAYTAADKAYPERRGMVYYGIESDKDVTPHVSIFTDRRIYRPGQTVKAKILAWLTKKHVEGEVMAGRKCAIELRDANYKVVETREVVTDEFGGAKVDFVLPQTGLTGRFSLSTNDGSTEFWVEEYKRPSFKVDFEPVDVEYKMGDTLAVYGMVKSFAGVPVQGAKVKFEVVRRPAIWWWWRRMAEQDKEILRGEALTDDDGRFKVDVPLTIDKPATTDTGGRYYVFNVLADATDVSGESHHGEMSVPLSDRAVAFSVEMGSEDDRFSVEEAQLLLAEGAHTLKFSYLNNAGRPLEGKVNYYIDDARKKQTVDANKTVDIDLRRLESGRHRLVATCGDERLEKEFLVFSMSDKRPVIETHDWFYATGAEFPRDGGAVKVQFGSSDEDQHVVYTIVSGRKLLESGSKDQSNALTTREFSYKDIYGEGILFTCAWVREGRLYTHSHRIAKPLPDERLKMEWTSFRDRLTPGQKEEWELRISDADGKPVKAQLLAGMFDRSLDEIRRHSWYFALGLWRAIPATDWQGEYNESFNLHSYMIRRYGYVPELDFSRFDASMFNIMPRFRHVYTRALGAASVEMSFSNSMDMDEAAPMMSAKPVLAKNAAGGMEPEKKNEVEMRENLAETAFFYPCLMSDENGHVKIAFTLPESVTTWRFMGFAHDKKLRHTGIEGEIVAKKKLMVQPNMPRFLRMGDEGSISARIFNTSENAIDGVSKIELLDPETQQLLYTQEQSFGVEAGKTAVVTFDVKTDDLPSLLICRVKAAGSGFSDGEQHYLPVMSNEELVTKTLPFSQNEAGTKTIDLKGLFPSTMVAGKGDMPKLTIEYTNNPAWLMVQALPTVAKPNAENAISLASAIYANSLSAYLLQQSPQIGQTIKLWQQEKGEETSMASELQKNQELKAMLLEETPWVIDADHEADQKRRLAELFDENQLQYRLDDFTEKLKRLQNSDGSFSWWPGMPGSPCTTVSVVETLVRLNNMLGEPSLAASILPAALGYLDRTMHDHVQELKKMQRKGVKNLLPSELAVCYLYIRSLDATGVSSTTQSDINYMVDLLAKRPTDLTIYGKAVSSIIMAKHNRVAQAKNLLQSIREYSVYTEEMGRYFDTRNAYYSWFDYKIPTVVAAIEAIRMLQPSDKQTVEEMQRWLLQSKRTQSWDTPINAVDAVYAFMNGETDKLSAADHKPATLKVDGVTLETATPTAGLGYVKTSLPGAHHETFTLEKSSEGTSWGALYAQYIQKSSDVSATSSGFTVKREVLVEGKNGRWTPSKNGTDGLKVGDRIRVRLTIDAARDYDFVQVQDKRAACLEPVVQLSGYRGGYYCTPRDNVTNYYFDQMAKGIHIVETEYYVDREGLYQSGTCTVECAYSPEYKGSASAEKLIIKKQNEQ